MKQYFSHAKLEYEALGKSDSAVHFREEIVLELKTKREHRLEPYINEAKNGINKLQHSCIT